MNDEGLVAKLVWDGNPESVLHVPDEMGNPAHNQLKGTASERLSELACRVCYDSLGRGRSSEDLHRHILEVGHLSVYEHAHATVRVYMRFDPLVLLNRPGLWAEVSKRITGGWNITFNPRTILEWNQWSKAQGVDDFIGKRGSLGDLLAYHAEQLYPMILAPRPRSTDYPGCAELIAPEGDEEKWITLFLGGSRGFSHELVRHGDFTAISQRSTRYVDEDGSPWVDHPLIREFLASTDPLPGDPDNRIRGALGAMIAASKAGAQESYRKVASWLQKWLGSRGTDKLTARKQARGAARGYLGNALYTELIFSASVGQWKRMLRMRCCDAADAEIRVIFSKALAELQRSRYGADFAAFTLQPSLDGLGQVAKEEREPIPEKAL